MRSIGQLTHEKHAQVFHDVLTAQGIHNQVDPDGAAVWTVWIRDEDQVVAGQEWLQRFRANPDSAEFRAASGAARQARAAAAADLAAYQSRLRNRRNIFPKFGTFGVGPLTFALIFLSVVVAVYTQLGDNREVVQRLVMADPANANGTFLPEIRAGEWWRLLTPTLVHFGLAHIVFNMMWLYQLGCMIEARRGPLTLALLYVVTGIVPIMAEYVFGQPGLVGGMSGVVYGLAGYVWMRGKYDVASGVYLDARSIQWMLIWLVICYSGVVGNVANTAHLVGLIIGVVWGRVAAAVRFGK